MSEWGPWHACSAPCGEGVQWRERRVLQDPRHGGAACGPAFETRPCSNGPCPVHCEVGGWTPWSECPPCGTNVRRSRTQVVGTPAAHGGRECSFVTQTEQCRVPLCVVDCVLSEWSPWSACQAPGIKTRTRTVVVPPGGGGRSCEHTTDVAMCGTGLLHNCPQIVNMTSTSFGSGTNGEGARRFVSSGAGIVVSANDVIQITAYLAATPLLREDSGGIVRILSVAPDASGELTTIPIYLEWNPWMRFWLLSVPDGHISSEVFENPRLNFREVYVDCFKFPFELRAYQLHRFRLGHWSYIMQSWD